MQRSSEIQMTSSGKPGGALVLSTSYTALGVVRSLGRNGIPVWIMDDKRSPTGYSRYIQRKFPVYVEDETRQLELLVDLAKRYDLFEWALFPDGDKGASFIARNYETLREYFKLTTPPWNVLQWSVDKRLTYQLAAEAGVVFPRTYFPENRSEIEQLEGNFPMIVKPTHHQGRDLFSTGRAWRANNRNELLTLYDMANGLAGSSIIAVQEMILGVSGFQFSYGALCEDGKVLADVSVERKRLAPPDCGVSSFVESIDKPEIEEPAKRWLEKNHYTGLVELDFMYDQRDGLYKLLDVNARAWGWIGMCPIAGVDFPFLMWKLVQGEKVEPVRGRAAVRWIRTTNDIESALHGLWNGSLALRDYLSSLKGVNHEVYAWDDPKPAYTELLGILGRVLMKIVRTLLMPLKRVRIFR
jgi:D-aspartate ligase